MAGIQLGDERKWGQPGKIGDAAVVLALNVER